MAAAPGGSSWSLKRFAKWTIGIMATCLIAMWIVAAHYFDMGRPSAKAPRPAAAAATQQKQPALKCQGTKTYVLTKGAPREDINPRGACQVRLVVDNDGAIELFSSGGTPVVFTKNNRDQTVLRRNEFLGMKPDQVIRYAKAVAGTAEFTVTLCPTTAPFPKARDRELWVSCRGS